MKTIILVVIKITSLFILTFIMFAHIESFVFLKKCNKDGTNTCIFPPIVSEITPHTRLSELIYKKFDLLVFNILYSRAKYGRFYMLQNINAIGILTTLVLYLIGVSRLTIVILLFLLKLNKNTTLDEILLNIFSHSYDNRKLVYIDGVWVANGAAEVLKEAFSSATTSTGLKINFTYAQKKKLAELMWSIVGIKDARACKLIINPSFNPDIAHRGIIGLTKNDSTIAMETCWKKAITFNNYNKVSLINKCDLAKPTRILLQPEIEIDKKTYIGTVVIKKHLLGAFLHGYNKDHLVDERIEDINRYEKATEGLKVLFAESGCTLDHEDILEKFAQLEQRDAIEVCTYLS